MWVQAADTATTGSLPAALSSPSLRMTYPTIASVAKRTALSPSSAYVVTNSHVAAVPAGTRGVDHGFVACSELVLVACSTTCSRTAPTANEAATAAAPPASTARRETRALPRGFCARKGRWRALGGCCTSCSSFACNSAANSARGAASSGAAERKSAAMR